ncbi:unnamed protein product [Urochloa humidicola]
MSNSYEQERLKQCMSNSKRLDELGIPWLASDIKKAMAAPEKSKRPRRNNENSGSEYDPTLDDTVGEDLMDVDSAQTSKKGSKKANTQTPDVPTGGGVKFRSRKRVFAQPPTVTTRSNQSKPQPKASLTATDLRAAIEGAGISFNDGNTNINTGAGISLHEENTNMPTGGDATARPDGNNCMSNEEGFVQQDDHTAIAEGADGITRPDGNHAMNNQEEEVEWNRGTNMGHGLQRLSRAQRGKLRIEITEGHQRPLVPLVASKFATECNIIVRNHIPVFTHWKEYKRDSQWFTSFCSFLRAKFEINTNDPIVKKACLQMMKDAVRQQRHKLKKDYFDPFPLHLVSRTSPIKSMSNDQWIALVESWKSPKKIHECDINKDNRSKVQFPQATKSQSYEVFIENIGDKYKDQDPIALDLFKECHFSKKKKKMASSLLYNQ